MKPERVEPMEIFERWLAGVETGHDVAFEEVVAKHHALADDLRKLHGTWNRMQAIEARVFDSTNESAAVYRGPGSLGEAGVELGAGARLGPYQMDREIGRGGMGVVWRARNLVLGDDVALKFLPFLLAKDRLAMMRLRREARVLLSLTHVNIVRLQTIEARRGLTFLVEEVLDGPNLEEYVEARGEEDAPALSPEEVLWILDEVVPALDYAHSEGVTHRDIKPSNLLLTHGPEGELGEGGERVKVADFGLAFIAGSALSKISNYRPSGTLPYMAPEVLMGEKPTPAADIYSLGATVYHLIHGEPPFARGDIATQVLHKAAPPVRSGDAGLDRAVAAALSKDPADRPASAEELLEIAWGERQAPTRRRRVPRALAVGLALAALAFLLAWQGPEVLRALGRDNVETQAGGAERAALKAAANDLVLAAPFDDASAARIGVTSSTPDLRGSLPAFLDARFVVYFDSIEVPIARDDDGSFLLMRPISTDRPTTIRFELDGVPLKSFEVEVTPATHAPGESDDASSFDPPIDSRGHRLAPIAGATLLAGTFDVVPAEREVRFEEAPAPVAVEFPRDMPAGMQPMQARVGAPAASLLASRFERRLAGGRDHEMRRQGAVDSALAWLTAHQSRDGAWDADGFDTLCDPDAAAGCDGPGAAANDVGATALATLAFLGDGHSPVHGTHRDTVRRAIAWLQSQQDPDTGLIGQLALPEAPVEAAADPAGEDDGNAIQRSAREDCDRCGGIGRLGGTNILCDKCNGRGFVRPRIRMPQIQPFADDTLTTAQGGMHGHALATQALCEAYTLSRSPVTLRHARAAVAYLERARNPYGGWHYESPPIGVSDTVVTGAALLALATARDAGLTVTEDAVNDGLSWIDEVSDPATGRVGYMSFGSQSARTPGNEHFPREKAEGLTAVALLARQLLGEEPETHPIMTRHADLLMRTPPEWDPEGFGCDMHAWFHGSHAMLLIGGRHAKTWAQAMNKTALESQRLDGHHKGSWDPIGPWGSAGGRVYATACMAMTLEAPYRYAIPE